MVEETEGVDGEDTGLVRGSGGRGLHRSLEGGSLLPGDALSRTTSLGVAEM